MEAIVRANHLDTAYDGDALSKQLNGAFSELFETEVEALWVASGDRGQCAGAGGLVPADRGDRLPPRRPYPE